MRLSKAWIIASKDLDIFRNNTLLTVNNAKIKREVYWKKSFNDNVPSQSALLFESKSLLIRLFH